MASCAAAMLLVYFSIVVMLAFKPASSPVRQFPPHIGLCAHKFSHVCVLYAQHVPHTYTHYRNDATTAHGRTTLP